MIYCFDIDGTLCTNTDGNYQQAQPFHEIIAQVNRLYAEGHRILLYTARGATTGVDWRELTEYQLNEWRVQYHELFMGKPTADVYIDDKAMNAVDWKHTGFRLDKFTLRKGLCGDFEKGPHENSKGEEAWITTRQKSS